MQNLLIAGGAGFIGSHFVRHILRTYPAYRVVVYDKLTYAGNLENLLDVQDDPRYAFVRGDIADRPRVEAVVRDQRIDTIVNLAAESHVDRSILNPDAFIKTDVLGTHVLLEVARQFGIERFIEVSTDEVYGSIEKGAFYEDDPLQPNSPYAASKAAADLMARAYFATYGLPVVITRGSNTFGPYQYPEKILPLFITNAIDNKPLPVYGDGKQVRDWLYVLDHCQGIDVALHRGEPGEIYNIAGDNERPNIEVTELLLEILEKPRSLIQHVADRPGHDRRYALDTTKIRALGWSASGGFEEALEITVRWYQENQGWWRSIIARPEFQEYYRKQYGQREVLGSY